LNALASNARQVWSAPGAAPALIREAGAGADHPVHPMLPKTAYLKPLVYAVELDFSVCGSQFPPRGLGRR